MKRYHRKTLWLRHLVKIAGKGWTDIGFGKPRESETLPEFIGIHQYTSVVHGGRQCQSVKRLMQDYTPAISGDVRHRQIRYTTSLIHDDPASAGLIARPPPRQQTACWHDRERFVQDEITEQEELVTTSGSSRGEEEEIVNERSMEWTSISACAKAGRIRGVSSFYSK